MTSERSGVVVAYPGGRQIYPVVRAAQGTGSLRAFATGLYLRPDSKALRLAELAARIPRAPRGLRALRERTETEIDPRLVRAFPFHALVEAALRFVPLGRPPYLLTHPRADARIARWLRSLEPAPAIVHGFEYGALSTLSVANARGCATVLDVLGSHEVNREVEGAEHPGRYSERIYRRIVAERAEADCLLAPSDFVVSCLVENGVPRERITRLPFGVDAARFRPAARSQDGTFRVLFVGEVGIRKGVRDLLEAWRRLRLPNAELVLIGGATTAGREILREYEGGHTWIPQLPFREVAAWFGRADVFAFPSLSEGSAYATYEAMASGLPLVTTLSSGSVARDGIEGFVVERRDVDAIAERLQTLHDDADLRLRMGAAARRRIEDGYTWSHYRERLGRLYEALLEGRPVPPRLDDDEVQPVAAGRDAEPVAARD